MRFSDQNLPIVCLVVVIAVLNFSHFHLLQNQKTILTQLGPKAVIDKSSFSEQKLSLFKKYHLARKTETSSIDSSLINL